MSGHGPYCTCQACVHSRVRSVSNESANTFSPTEPTACPKCGGPRCTTDECIEGTHPARAPRVDALAPCVDVALVAENPQVKKIGVFVKASDPPEKRREAVKNAARAAATWLEAGVDFDITLELVESKRGGP
jgi:hypothetical protein